MSLTIGIDVGGTKIAGGLVDESGEILNRARIETPRHDAQAVEAAVIDVVNQLAKGNRVEAVGLGTAGFIDVDRSRVLLAPNLGWRDESLGAAVEAGTGLPVVVENDANAAAWGEYRFGGATGSRNLVCITIGTGIGGGLVLDGQLYRGASGVAAEIGHMTVEPGGRLCGCGNRGCWEQYASGNALVRAAREFAAERRLEARLILEMGDGTPEGISGSDVTDAAKADAPIGLAAFEYIAGWLGLGMANLAAILDPGMFVLGGGVSEAGDLILIPTRRAFLAALSGKEFRQMPAVTLATLGNDAGIVGAADLARL